MSAHTMRLLVKLAKEKQRQREQEQFSPKNRKQTHSRRKSLTNEVATPEAIVARRMTHGRSPSTAKNDIQPKNKNNNNNGNKKQSATPQIGPKPSPMTHIRSYSEPKETIEYISNLAQLAYNDSENENENENENETDNENNDNNENENNDNNEVYAANIYAQAPIIEIPTINVETVDEVGDDQNENHIPIMNIAITESNEQVINLGDVVMADPGLPNQISASKTNETGHLFAPTLDEVFETRHSLRIEDLQEILSKSHSMRHSKESKDSHIQIHHFNDASSGSLNSNASGKALNEKNTKNQLSQSSLSKENKDENKNNPKHHNTNNSNNSNNNSFLNMLCCCCMNPSNTNTSTTTTNTNNLDEQLATRDNSNPTIQPLHAAAATAVSLNSDNSNNTNNANSSPQINSQEAENDTITEIPPSKVVAGTDATLEPGDVRLWEEPFGKGASGRVHKAIYLPLCQVLAAKVVNRLDNENVRQVLGEFKDQQELLPECDRLMRILGWYSDEHTNSVVIALEYMDMGSIYDSCFPKDLRGDRADTQNMLNATIEEQEKSGHKQIEIDKLTYDQIRYIAREVLIGLVALHGCTPALVHRDIKPQNILASSVGEVKIADFGLLKRLNRKTNRLTDPKGTEKYFSPERIDKNYGTGCDIWALGVTMIEIYNQKLIPSEKLDWFKLAQDGINIAEFIDTESEETPKEFVEFLELCLCKEEEKRPSAKELLGHRFVSRVWGNPMDMAEEEEKCLTKNLVQFAVNEPDQNMLDKLLGWLEEWILEDEYGNAILFSEGEPKHLKACVYNLARFTGNTPEYIDRYIAEVYRERLNRTRTIDRDRTRTITAV